MAGSTYDLLKEKKNQLIRKALDGSVFAAPESATAITALTDAADSLLAPLPTGYWDLGLLTDDGAQYSESVDTSDVTSWGSTEPTRSDITKDTTTLQVSCQETKLGTIGLYVGVDTSTITPATGSGEVQIAKPAVPRDMFYRVLSVAVDYSDDGEIYVARFLPRAKRSDKADQKLSSGDDPVLWGVTFTSFMDSTLGFSEKHIFGGPGWKALLADMGFTTGT